LGRGADLPLPHSSWGSFIQLHDKSLKTQVTLCEELAEKYSNEDEKKVAVVWNACMAKFKEWDDGKGDLEMLTSELAVLAAVPSESPAAWSEGLATYFVKCALSGVSIPINFDKGANLSDSENIVLDLGGGSGSLPSRDYYTEELFAEQRGQFLAHLGRIKDMFSLEEDFPERVMRFETKLAQISMKSDQSRQYDQYFTVTTMEGFLAGVNDMKSLAEKGENYKANVVAEEDPDKAVLTEPEFQVDEQHAAEIKSFMEKLYSGLDLAKWTTANYKEHYTDGGAVTMDPATAESRMLVFDGDYFRRICALILPTHNIADVRAYMSYNIIKWGGQYCTKELDEEMFAFYSRTLGGQKEQKSYEKRTVGRVNAWVGELLGKVYVDRYFSSEDKDTVKGMIGEVIDVMQNSLKTNDWLTEPTKEKALKKLAKFTTKIGYPDKWKSHDRLDFADGDDVLALRRKVARFEHATEFCEKLNTPKDKTKWEMHPHQVNAYFHPLNNEIVFPAAILQPPFYHKGIEDIQFCLDVGSGPQHVQAVNFGAIGAVIAHEITHGYDDQGRKFDDCGNIVDWWQEGDAELFKAKTELMKSQAESYIYTETKEDGTTQEHKMNGDLTMGENLADLGGMSLAVQALQKKMGEVEGSKMHLQLFYRSWANVWKSKHTSADAIKKLATDPHAPAAFRCNLVKNVDSYYEAFGVDESHPMFIPKEKRVQMW